MPLRPWQRWLMEQDLERSRLMGEAWARDTVKVTFHPWSNEMTDADAAYQQGYDRGRSADDKRQEDLNHLCRFVVAGLLMAFGQYGRDGAVRHVSDLWKETEKTDA